MARRPARTQTGRLRSVGNAARCVPGPRSQCADLADWALGPLSGRSWPGAQEEPRASASPPSVVASEVIRNETASHGFHCRETGLTRRARGERTCDPPGPVYAAPAKTAPDTNRVIGSQAVKA